MRSTTRRDALTAVVGGSIREYKMLMGGGGTTQHSMIQIKQ